MKTNALFSLYSILQTGSFSRYNKNPEHKQEEK